MKKHFSIVILIFIVLISCTNKENPKATSPLKVSTGKSKLSWQNWQIEKGALGPLKIGSNISEYRNDLKGFDSVAVDAFLYKYDGGGVAYEYSYNKKPLFVLMPAIDTDSIIAVMTLHSDFKTIYGTSSGNSVARIVKQYKKLPVILDLLSGGEVMTDTVNRIKYVFDTPDDAHIAEYPDIDNPGLLKRSNTTCDWITIY
nr:hypothetical protein [uncultured Flavobacterium sp.]